MNETPNPDVGRHSLRGRFFRWLISRRTQKRALIGLAALATLIAIFYTEENWRGKRAWEQCKRELEAKGAVLDWEKYIPSPVPDDQNFFKAPKMTDWFVGRNRTNDFYLRMNDKKFETMTGSVTTATNLIATTTEAKAYLAWSDQFEPDFDLIREALKRPYARMDGDYSRPFEIPIPNFMTMRVVAQTLAQRTHCFLMLGQPERALHELALLNGYRRLLENAPTGKPMTLVGAMINVAVTGVYVQTLAEGFQRQAWRDTELTALQEQLAEINLAPCFAQAFACEPAAVCRTAEIMEPRKILAMEILPSDPQAKKSFMENLWGGIKSLPSRLFNQVPRGWIYQNMATHARLSYSIYDSLFDANQLVTPQRSNEARNRVQIEVQRTSIFNRLSKIGLPNYSKALQTFAGNQTRVNEAQIVCALERYRLAHGEFPETLDTLVPQLIEKLPHDIIGGQPLHYRREAGGKFLLYSVGWNETDDGGEVALKKDGSEDREKGDWVWKQ
jgi:hypothetical protein